MPYTIYLPYKIYVQFLHNILAMPYTIYLVLHSGDGTNIDLKYSSMRIFVFYCIFANISNLLIIIH